ncbi:hypothetical protein [Streptomyces collinus]|uniref:Uncharacterized protein n=1 Tax=Streptomyces collinus TaxID=42684 RepID=A0AA89U1A5_STRCU|nr:hypothetical protein [Streptomyces collinus]MBB5815413.1 hypothetical protein [Streptomyces collinus]WMX68336.1 hypothetical protein RFN52_35345 [Streptomyces collinus]
MRNRGELRAAEAAPWRYTESHLPEFTPGALDAAAILKSVNETLLPVVEEELHEATEKLGAALADKQAEADLVSTFRAELMRRVLPQFTEAVRRGVLESIRTRQMHLAQLAVLHRHVLEAKKLTTVLTRLDHEAAKAGLQIVDDTGDPSLFNVVEDQPGVMKREPVTFELIAPAYVDKESGKLVERGWLRAVAEAQLPKPSLDEVKPGQRRRANQAEAKKKQLEKKAPAQHGRKKYHRGQDPEKQQNRGNGKGDGAPRPRPAGNGDRRRVTRKETR